METPTQGTSTAVVTTGNKLQTVKNLLMENQQEIFNALPKHLNPAHFIRTAVTSITKNPALLECTIPSLMGALLQSAQLGLSPDGILGEAYLIPYNNNRTGKKEVQFIPGYRGLLSLAQRSGQVKSFQAREVYESDEFSFEFGLEPKLKHIPNIKANTPRGSLMYVYAVCNFINGGYVFEVMNMEEIEYIRKQSKQPDGNAWKNYYPEMAKKTVIRKISKICPLSPEFQKAVGLSETFELLGDSQKNDRELINYNIESEEVVKEMDEQVQAEAKEVVEVKKRKRSDKVKKATETALNKITENKNEADLFMKDLENRIKKSQSVYELVDDIEREVQGSNLSVLQKNDLMDMIKFRKDEVNNV